MVEQKPGYLEAEKKWCVERCECLFKPPRSTPAPPSPSYMPINERQQQPQVSPSFPRFTDSRPIHPAWAI